MKLFISWSKEPAKSIAQELRHVIPMVLPGVIPWMSEIDIPKGGRWSPEIAQQLDGTDTGVIIVTSTNRTEPWLFFEAGALSKSVADGRVHPLTVGIEKHDLVGPLSQFQATAFDRADFLKLLFALNKDLEVPLPESDIEQRFNRLWTGLETNVKAALERNPNSSAPAKVETSPPVAINDDQARVLRKLVDSGGRRLTPNDMFPLLGNMHAERIRLHLDALTEAGLTFSLNSARGRLYGVETKGREFAAEKGWI
ncbi:hypothetical protein D9M68_222920 [compost metagenome]